VVFDANLTQERWKPQFPCLLLRLQKLIMSCFCCFQLSDGCAQRSACRVKAANVSQLFGGKSEDLFGEIFVARRQ
jgi:hypothetical protein